MLNLDEEQEIVLPEEMIKEAEAVAKQLGVPVRKILKDLLNLLENLPELL